MTTTTKLRCIAVDDEPFALRLMADDIARIPYLQLVASFTAPAEAITWIDKNPVDLLFTDIQMPGMLGTQMVRMLKKPPMIIMTTAYEQYALEGFELDVIDYLVKPIPFERFQKAVSKALEQFHLKHQKKEEDGRFFFVRAEYKEIKILYADILYIEGLKDYVKIFLGSQSRPVMTRLNLKAVESKLPPEEFCRIHNSFIVPLSKITSSQRSQVFVGLVAIPVGEKYAPEFRKKYRQEA